MKCVIGGYFAVLTYDLIELKKDLCDNLFEFY